MTEQRKRAVQYLRMSTEHQRYSLENQRAAIAEYAELEGYQIVRTYSDAGKSGLHLRGRLQLQQLLSDCLSPQRDFDTILVLDVSRWGRFQDPDEAAYYEFVCRGAGVRVAYPGETFTNDGGLVSSIVKHLKRVMAAEYSRELSAKITRAKHQQAGLGYWMGGPPAYGFRRRVVDRRGRPGRLLAPGQYKGAHSDRIILVPGPPRELQTIRRIFHLFVDVHRNFKAVAEHLNQEGSVSRAGRPWTRNAVSAVIRNELVIGTLTYGKTRSHLRGARQRIAGPDRTRSPAFAGTVLIEKSLFRRANRLADGRRHIFSDKYLLQALRRHLRTHGTIKPKGMKADPTTPHPRTYEARFGSMRNACQRIGHDYVGKQKSYPQVGGYWTCDAIVEAVRRHFEEYGRIRAADFQFDRVLPGLSVVNQRFGGLLNCYEAAGLPLTSRQQFWKDWRAERPRRDFLAPDGLELGPMTTDLVSDLLAD